MQVSHCGGFSCCSSWGLEHRGSLDVVHMLSCSSACEIFPDQRSNPHPLHRDFPGGSDHSLPATQETQVQSLGQEDPLEKGMTVHSSILAWRIPWTEEHGGAAVYRVAKNPTQLSNSLSPVLASRFLSTAPPGKS